MLSAIFVTLGVLVLGLYAGIAWGVVRKYRRTGNVGFLILGAGVVAWPLLSQLLGLVGHMMIERVLSGGTVGFFPFSLLSSGQLTVGQMVALSTYGNHAIQGGLILMGVLSLGRGADTATAPVSLSQNPRQVL